MRKVVLKFLNELVGSVISVRVGKITWEFKIGVVQICILQLKGSKIRVGVLGIVHDELHDWIEGWVRPVMRVIGVHTQCS